MKKIVIVTVLLLIFTLIGCQEVATTSVLTMQSSSTTESTTTTSSLSSVTTTTTTMTTTRILREDETLDIAQDFDLSAVSFASPISPLTLHSVISDHAILQQNKPIRIFGSGTPGSIALVKLVMNDNQAIAYLNYEIIGSNGKFLVELPALTASFNDYTLTVSDTQNEIQIQDLLIGEVWLTAGQSNMAMEVREVEEGN